MNELNAINREVKTITSREICKITGQQHCYTVAVIKSLIDAKQIKKGEYEMTSYVDRQNREQTMVKLDKLSSLSVVSKQSPTFIVELIWRWVELEKQAVNF